MFCSKNCEESYNGLYAKNIDYESFPYRKENKTNVLISKNYYKILSMKEKFCINCGLMETNKNKNVSVLMRLYLILSLEIPFFFMNRFNKEKSVIIRSE